MQVTTECLSTVHGGTKKKTKKVILLSRKSGPKKKVGWVFATVSYSPSSSQLLGNTSDLQEVDRQLQAEKTKTATLETQVIDLLTRVTALENT